MKQDAFERAGLRLLEGSEIAANGVNSLEGSMWARKLQLLEEVRRRNMLRFVLLKYRGPEDVFWNGSSQWAVYAEMQEGQWKFFETFIFPIAGVHYYRIDGDGAIGR